MYKREIPIGSSTELSNFSRWFYLRTHIMRHLNKNQTKQKNGACFNQHRPTTFHCYKLKEKNLNLFLKETQTRRQTFLCRHCRGSKEATVSSKGDMG